MSSSADITVFFNFRSPYCYLASKTMFGLFDDFHARFIWRPLGGWNGRSDPERSKKKVPVARQDVARFARRMGIPLTPPPITTDPTKAATLSLLAEELGLLRQYIVEVMRAEWAEGRDIGQEEILLGVAQEMGIEPSDALAALEREKFTEQLEENWKAAQETGVFGVPAFVVQDQIYWGQDRIDFVKEHLRELRLSRL